MHTLLSRRALPVSLLFLSVSASAQKTADSTSQRVLNYLAGQFAVARPFNLEYTGSLPFNYTPKYENTKLPPARMNHFSQLKASANVSFLKSSKWLAGATVGYRYTDLSTTMRSLTGTQIQEVDNDFHYLFASVNVNHFSRLFNKTVIYSGSLIADGSEESFGRIKGLLSATMVLRADAKVRMSAGLLVNIDGGSQLPVFPLFMYENKLGKGWTADIILPRQFLLRKYIPGHGRLSIGTQLDVTIFYMQGLGANTTQKFEYRQTDILNGLIYEHLLGKHFILTGKAGLRVTTNGRIFEKSKTFADGVFETSPKPGGYFNVGVSFNPFFKKKVK
ncbi:hypothetical protein LZZ85_01030 [Terrimonas sp. NA20]|uniref:Uncharacterized protein n=1 Tax=Terrimonas ginsenosidimutans TaxID=2908004 RepID=A0ABS9KKI2_9BACT|nr:hypothetical protein [Terrimonas ginsenosidimutans]MCG2612833.1 hypothetical protein [Terrimonas ginsenosidimutans]